MVLFEKISTANFISYLEKETKGNEVTRYMLKLKVWTIKLHFYFSLPSTPRIKEEVKVLQRKQKVKLEKVA